MNIVKLALVGLFGLSCAACVSDNVNVSSTPTNYQVAIPADAQGVKLNDIDFKVVTKDSLNQFVKDQQAAQGNQNPVFIIVGSNGYKAIRLNIAELQRYIQQQKSIIVYYKKEIAAMNSANQTGSSTKN